MLHQPLHRLILPPHGKADRCCAKRKAEQHEGHREVAIGGQLFLHEPRGAGIHIADGQNVGDDFGVEPAGGVCAESLGPRAVVAHMDLSIQRFDGYDGLIVRCAAQQAGKLRGGEHRRCINRFAAAVYRYLRIQHGETLMVFQNAELSGFCLLKNICTFRFGDRSAVSIPGDDAARIDIQFIHKIPALGEVEHILVDQAHVEGGMRQLRGDGTQQIHLLFLRWAFDLCCLADAFVGAEGSHRAADGSGFGIDQITNEGQVCHLPVVYGFG